MCGCVGGGGVWDCGAIGGGGCVGGGVCGWADIIHPL